MRTAFIVTVGARKEGAIGICAEERTFEIEADSDGAAREAAIGRVYAAGGLEHVFVKRVTRKYVGAGK